MRKEDDDEADGGDDDDDDDDVDDDDGEMCAFHLSVTKRFGSFPLTLDSSCLVVSKCIRLDSINQTTKLIKCEPRWAWGGNGDRGQCN